MSCATTVFDIAALKDMLIAGTSGLVEFDVDVSSYRVADDMDAATGAKASYIVSSRMSEGEVPQQQSVIESNDGESAGETTIGAATAVQVDLDVTGNSMVLGISGTG